VRSGFGFAVCGGVRVCIGIWGRGKLRGCDCDSSLVRNELENESWGLLRS